LGISSSASTSCSAFMATSTASASRARRWARITPAMLAFQASSSKAGASTCRKGRASGKASAGAFIRRSSGSAANSTISVHSRPMRLLAPSAASARLRAASRWPAPSACVSTTPMPAPTMRNSRNSVICTWLASAKAPAAVSLTRAASAVATTPTAMPSANSTNSGHSSGQSLGVCGRCGMDGALARAGFTG
jgi:hypothetical protein